MIGKISHVMLWARDLDRTAKWYKEKLSFTVSYHAPGEFLSLYHDRMGRMDFHAGAREHDIGAGPMPYFIVEDIAKVKAWLESKDVKVSAIQQEAESPKHAWFDDSEGNQIGIEED